MNWQPIEKLVPRPVEGAIHDALAAGRLRRAPAGVAALPPAGVPGRGLLEELQLGWDNEGMAADTDFYEEVARRAAETRGPILECGSGLTTLLLGLILLDDADRPGEQEALGRWAAEANLETDMRVTDGGAFALARVC